MADKVYGVVSFGLSSPTGGAHAKVWMVSWIGMYQAFGLATLVSSSTILDVLNW